MDGISEIKELPTTKTGYTFVSEAELREAKWLVEQGDFEDLDEFGASSQMANDALRAYVRSLPAQEQKKWLNAK